MSAPGWSEMHARVGMFHLEEAVLDVLADARSDEPCLGPAEISRRARIFRKSQFDDRMHDAITAGILNKLFDDDRVEHCNQESGRQGWKITDNEHRRRQSIGR